MNAQELTLNIAVNLGRIGRWACENRRNRIEQFLEETENYIEQLEQVSKSPRFQQTFNIFKDNFIRLKNDVRSDPEWAEMMFTWADILAHRAKLA
jgi:hypothetical protein